ncbi:MAG: hypothetical protein IJ303_00390, partial [Clostridia bacterium]|nr:hypothetical protein [Clostridia bacterium]
MMKTLFKRSTAFALALIMAIGCGQFAVFATDTEETADVLVSAPIEVTPTEDDSVGGSSVSDTTIEDVREILNAISYEEYSKKSADIARAEQSLQISALDYLADKTDAKVSATKEYPAADGGELESLFIPGDGTVVWGVEIPATAKYSIQLEYYPIEAKSVPVQRIFRVNGKIPFAESRYITMSKVWSNTYEELDAETGRKFKLDIDRNELRPIMAQTPEWRVYELRDGDGFYSESFEFVFEAGYNEISLESVSEPMALKSITLVPHTDLPSYESVSADYASKGYAPADKDSCVYFEAEEPIATSSQTVYPVEDVSSAITSPSDSTRIILNTIGGEKWQTPGQWARYKFTPEKSGLYNI